MNTGAMTVAKDRAVESCTAGLNGIEPSTRGNRFWIGLKRTL